MFSGRNWMLYLGIGLVVILGLFFVWRQLQPTQEALAVTAGARESGAEAGSVVAVAEAPANEAVAALPKSGRIKPKEYQSAFVEASTPHLLVDVRTPQEFNSGYIEGAVNIPLQELAQRADEIPTDQPVVLYCRSGNRSSNAARMLSNAGYEQVYDLGGVIDWQRQGLPLQ
jgi:phage shock protein E